MEPAFFGEPWGAPACEGPRAPTPVGDACMNCDELIVEGDRGFLQHALTKGGWRWLPVHLECQIRMVVGSPAHLRGECSCHGGAEPDTGLTRREEALESYRWVMLHGVG